MTIALTFENLWKGLVNLTHDQLLEYLVKGAHASANTIMLVKQHCKDHAIKLLNLCHQWIASVLPHVLSKVNRVSYGLLDDRMLERAANATVSRKLLCVPFVGKDVPSPASEFSHPEVVIGLTVAGYRHEGLRLHDWRILIAENKDMLKHEVGRISERPTAKRWNLWVQLAGGRVRGLKSKKKTPSNAPAHAPQAQLELVQGTDTRLLPNKWMADNKFLQLLSPGAPQPSGCDAIDEDILNSIWPLHLVDTKDKEQVEILKP